jgi:carbon monoxide dehydrogenase subunit G
MHMTHITGDIHINASKEQVWDILADLGGIKSFHPGLTDSYYQPGSAKRGIGASRHCDLKPSGSVEETAVRWEEGESYTLRIHDGKNVPPFILAHGTVAVRANGSGTVASMVVEYSLKFGPLGRLMDALMVRRHFEKVVPAILGGLKKYVESRPATTA